MEVYRTEKGGLWEKVLHVGKTMLEKKKKGGGMGALTTSLSAQGLHDS